MKYPDATEMKMVYNVWWNIEMVWWMRLHFFLSWCICVKMSAAGVGSPILRTTQLTAVWFCLVFSFYSFKCYLLSTLQVTSVPTRPSYTNRAVSQQSKTAQTKQCPNQAKLHRQSSVPTKPSCSDKAVSQPSQTAQTKQCPNQAKLHRQSSVPTKLNCSDRAVSQPS